MMLIEPRSYPRAFHPTPYPSLGRPVRRAVVQRLGAAELRELNRIGVNLNQIARALNAGAGAPSGTRAAVERCHEAVRVLLRREAGIP